MAILSDDEVKLRISADTTGGAAVDQLAKNIDELAKQGGEAAPALGRLSGELRKMQTDAAGLDGAIGKAGAGLGGFVTAVKPVAAAIAAAFGAQEVVRMAADFDSLNRAMAAIQGQGVKAAAEVGYILDAANRLGIEVQSTAKAYTSWLASIKGTALEGEKGRAVFEAVAGAMAKLGKSAADTEGAMKALGQMVSKGKVSMEELRGQLGERLPGAMQAAAKGAGLTVEQLSKMVESGQVLAEDLLPGLAVELNKLYGNTQADGMVNQWNRLKNAVFETVGQISQSEIVVASFNLGTLALRETLLILGTLFISLTESVGLFGKTLGATAAAISTGNWSGLGEQITKMATESGERIRAMAEKTLIAEAAQTAFGSAVASSASAAAAAANQYLAINAAYTDVNAAVAKQVELVEAALKARQAEAAFALEYVAQFGTEAEKRAEAAEQARAEAEALQRVAEAKQLQASISAAQLAALQAEVAAMEQISPARKKEIEELTTSTKLKAEEAAQSASAAAASKVRAAGLQTETEAYADNSKRVVELRDAWRAASAEADTLAAALKAGAASKEDYAAASVRAGQAEKLYRDSLADSITALQAKAAVTRSQIDLESKGRSLQLEQIQTQIEVARARGRDNEVARLQIDYARVQMEMSNLKAKALRAEAEAQMALIAAKRAELEASGQLTEVKRLELDAQQKAAEAKIIDARIAEELASRTRQLKDVVRGTASEMDAAAESAEKLGDSWDGAANSADRYASSARAAAKAAADGTETRGFRQGAVDTYAIAAENGLNDAEAKRFAEVYQEFLAKANAEVRSRAAGTQGLGFGPKEYADIISYYTQRALEQAKMDVNTPGASASSSAGAGQASALGMGQIVKTVYQVDLRTNAGTQTVTVADQPSVDALLKTLQEYKSRS